MSPTRTSITTAVFPVGGLGTRFLPATKAQPKEMLPVVDKPLIQYAVEEAYAAGIRKMVFVNGRNKRAIPDHFDTAYELESELANANKQTLLDAVRAIKPDDMDCIYIRQPKALGLGHAVHCAKSIVAGEAFSVLLADDLMVGTPPVLAQMVEQYNELQASIIAVQSVPRSHTKRYGIVDGRRVSDRLMDLTTIIEKPEPEQAPTNLGVAGRYILTSSIFREISAVQTGFGGEIQLTDGIASLMKSEKVYAYHYHGKRYDCGSKEGFLEANVELGLAHPELGTKFREFLKDLEL